MILNQMKRYVFTAFCCAAGLTAIAQNHLGSVVLDFNTGFEYYNSSNTYSVKRVDRSTDTTVNANAGNSNASLGLEVGIGRFIGIGVRAKTSLFFRTLDAVVNSRADVTSSELLGMINLHVLPFKKFDLVLGGEFGFSRLKYDSNDLYQTLVTGTGGYFAVNINPRFYVKRLGFNVRAALPVFSYSDLQRSNNAGSYVLSRWKASGIGVSIGVQYRFF